jgi:trehalose 6-phosphate synthase
MARALVVNWTPRESAMLIQSDHAERHRSIPGTPQRLIVVANRAPFCHHRGADGHIVTKSTGSGLVTALQPVVAAYHGTWVALASGDADTLVVDDHAGLDVPSESGRYRLRYVSLSEQEHRGYYYGFANEGLWPLCHAVGVRPVFRWSDFRMYQAANDRFAAAVAADAAGGSPTVLVQDYHFALAPRAIRHHVPESTVVSYWHIPWPSPEVFDTCPWARELLDGMLGSHVLGFQSQTNCRNFLQTVALLLDADVDLDRGTIEYRGGTTAVRAYPVGVEWNNHIVQTTPAAAICREQVCRELQLPSTVRLAVGIDRLDYTKGINEKLLAVERLLETAADLRGHFVFVQVAEPSRDSLPAYRAARAQLLETGRRVNARFGTSSYQPVRILEAHHPPAEVYRFYRAADLCYVGSLHDGMNLVAKEFVCARDDERGVLVLSRFAGAAQQLRSALLINPYIVEQAATALHQALSMPVAEQATRMRRMRATVEALSSEWWAQQLLGAAAVHGTSRRRTHPHVRAPYQAQDVAIGHGFEDSPLST